MLEALVYFSFSFCLSVPRFSFPAAFRFFTDIHSDNDEDDEDRDGRPPLDPGCGVGEAD